MRKFKLNPKAGIFFDQASGIKVLPNQEVEISDQLIARHRRIFHAISNHHLLPVTEEQVNLEPVVTMEDMIADIQEMVSKEMSEKVIANKFKMKTLESICESLEIIPEEGDTKADLVLAIIDSLNDIETSDENPDVIVTEE